MANVSQIRTIGQLASSVRRDPELAKQLQEDPVKILDEINTFRIPNTRVYQIVVISLGAAVLVALAGAIAISLRDQTDQIPDILVAVASAAVGALAGLLTPQTTNE